LYLVSQALELGLAAVLALNMVDVARQRGMSIDAALLSRRLGMPVIEIQANRRLGLEDLKAALERAAAGQPSAAACPFPEPFCQEIDKLSGLFEECRRASSEPALPRALVERLLLDTSGYLEGHLFAGNKQDESRFRALSDELRAARVRLNSAGLSVPGVEAMARYRWIAEVLEGVVSRPATRPHTWSDRLDRVLTHRLWGSLFFLLMMVVVFQSVFRVAEWPMSWIESGTAAVSDWVAARMADGALRSLIIKGLIGGVGGVVIFLPQIMILFFFIAILEDCGYMARAAYLMDKLMARVGLSGKSFIPLLSSFACAIPGVMAARVIENRRDRLTTILVAPLMSCSARLPVYTLLIAAFIPARSYLGGVIGLQGLTMTAMYLVGIVTAAAVAWLLKRTLLRGPTPPFVMELPTYKWPSAGTVLYRMVERGWAFVRRAGTLVVAVSIVVWAALYYPHSPEVEAPFQNRKLAIESQLAGPVQDDAERTALLRERAKLEHEIAGAYNRQSILGRFGRWLEPAVRPLGWDWRIGSAVLASFPAREVVVATLGIIYNLGEELDLENDEDQNRLQEVLRQARWEATGEPVFNVPVALSIMVFFALCAQCASTLVIIKRETNSWGWPMFTFGYMTALAYVAALVTYQVGMLLPAV
ncbi:MAG TPA: ferrous iron transport protein B, partial [Pirellulales bacterium]|nr:ferrous iron transport protein B [Pirellulales bacterium]